MREQFEYASLQEDGTCMGIFSKIWNVTGIRSTSCRARKLVGMAAEKRMGLQPEAVTP